MKLIGWAIVVIENHRRGPRRAAVGRFGEQNVKATTDSTRGDRISVNKVQRAARTNLERVRRSLSASANAPDIGPESGVRGRRGHVSPPRDAAVRTLVDEDNVLGVIVPRVVNHTRVLIDRRISANDA